MALVRLHNTDGPAWTRVALGDAIPETGPVLLALGDWLNKPIQRPDPVGVWLEIPQGPEDFGPHIVELLASLPAIGLHFTKFNDGRPYSVARILRERYGYKGELVASGDVLIDQVRHMVAVGIDVFEPRKGFTHDDVLQAQKRPIPSRRVA